MRFAKIALAAASLTFAFSSTAARAACQPGAPGCVLPLPGPVVSTPAPSPGPSPEPLLIEEEAEFNFLPFLIGLAALGAAAYFLFFDDDEDDVPGPTPSP